MTMQCVKPLDTGRKCNSYVFKCKNCNSVGCRNKDCAKQNFDASSGRCLTCGKTSALS